MKEDNEDKELLLLEEIVNKINNNQEISQTCKGQLCLKFYKEKYCSMPYACCKYKKISEKPSYIKYSCDYKND